MAGMGIVPIYMAINYNDDKLFFLIQFFLHIEFLLSKMFSNAFGLDLGCTEEC